MTPSFASPNPTVPQQHPDGSLAALPRRAVESRDPATGTVWRRFDALDAAQVDALVARARSAQLAWEGRPLRERIDALDAFHGELFRRRLDVAGIISRENGKAIPEALASEVAVTLDMVRFVTRNAPTLLSAPWFTPSSLAFWRKRARIEHEPFGVIAVISPWNYPFMLPAGLVLTGWRDSRSACARGRRSTIASPPGDRLGGSVTRHDQPRTSTASFAWRMGARCVFASAESQVACASSFAQIDRSRNPHLSWRMGPPCSVFTRERRADGL